MSILDFLITTRSTICPPQECQPKKQSLDAIIFLPRTEFSNSIWWSFEHPSVHQTILPDNSCGSRHVRNMRSRSACGFASGAISIRHTVERRRVVYFDRRKIDRQTLLLNAFVFVVVVVEQSSRSRFPTSALAKPPGAIFGAIYIYIYELEQVVEKIWLRRIIS